MGQRKADSSNIASSQRVTIDQGEQRPSELSKKSLCLAAPKRTAKLNKKLFLNIPKDVYLVSNLCRGQNRPIFAEVVESPEAREEQWNRIVSSGANDHLFDVFRDRENYERHLRWLAKNGTRKR